MTITDLLNFLNITQEVFEALPAELKKAFQKAADEDDYMKAHHLAYAIE